MTFREVKDELARYSLGPGERLTVKKGRGWGRPIVRFRLEVLRPRLDDPDRQTETITDVYLPLHRCYPANIRAQIVDMWRARWDHELEEWLRKDGRHVFDPHGVRS